MRVSVLIPTYNRAPFLGAAIESVLKQSYQDFEIIVADDGSTDDSAAVARGYERVRYISQAHSGIPAARNFALSAAEGELIAWLDSDDLWTPEKLEKQVEYLRAHPECQIVFCRIAPFTDIPDEALTPRQRELMRPDHAEKVGYLATACIRKALFEKWGGFNLRYDYMEDTEWEARVGAGGVDFGHCLREPLYLRRVHDGQVTYSHKKPGRREIMTMFADVFRRSKKKENVPC